MGLFCGHFDHTDRNDGVHNGFIELFECATTSPNVGTAGKIFRVSASYYRRLFATVSRALL